MVGSYVCALQAAGVRDTCAHGRLRACAYRLPGVTPSSAATRSIMPSASAPPSVRRAASAVSTQW
eukprot:4688794-Prymnesium_polylepis.1